MHIRSSANRQMCLECIHVNRVPLDMEADAYPVLVLSYRSFASKKVTWLLSTFWKLLPTMVPCQTQTYFSDKRGLSGIGGA